MATTLAEAITEAFNRQTSATAAERRKTRAEEDRKALSDYFAQRRAAEEARTTT